MNINLSFKKIVLFCVFFAHTLLINAQASRFRLMFNQNAQSYVVAWVQESDDVPILIYDDNDNFKSDSLLSRACVPDYQKYKGIKNYFAYFDSLKPETIYRFAIQNENNISQVYWFKTLSENPDSLSVIAGGDSRSNPDIRQLANKMVAKLQPDFVIFDGDFTYSSTKKEWLQWLEDWQLTIADNHLIPIVVAMGNHENNNDLHNFFCTPVDNFYSLTFGNLFYLSILNSNDEYLFDKQADFLKNGLDSADVAFKTVVFHKPVRPHYSKKREGDDIYDVWVNAIFEGGTNLVLEGDTHVSMITYPIKPSTSADADEGFVRDDVNGTVYTGEGTWGAPLRPADDSKSWTIDAASINQFKWILITADKMEIRTVKYENVDEVEPLFYQNNFKIPAGLDLWKPAGKETVIINKR